MALYKRKTYLINKTFQLKFSFFLVFIVISSSLVYPITIYELYNSVAMSIKSQFPHASEEFLNRKSIILQLLLIGQLFFSLLIFIIGIFLSHKVAGPIYKIQKYIQAIRKNNKYDKVILRNGDHFSELAKEYNKSITYLNTKYEIARLALDEIKKLVDENEHNHNSQQIKIKIEELKQEFE